MSTHVHADPPDREDLYLRVHAGHEPEELLAVLVPLHRVQLAARQRVVAHQVRRAPEDQLPRHAQTLHTQRPAACNIFVNHKYFLCNPLLPTCHTSKETSEILISPVLTLR